MEQGGTCCARLDGLRKHPKRRCRNAGTETKAWSGHQRVLQSQYVPVPGTCRDSYFSVQFCLVHRRLFHAGVPSSLSDMHAYASAILRKRRSAWSLRMELVCPGLQLSRCPTSLAPRTGKPAWKCTAPGHRLSDRPASQSSRSKPSRQDSGTPYPSGSDCASSCFPPLPRTPQTPRILRILLVPSSERMGWPGRSLRLHARFPRGQSGMSEWVPSAVVVV